MNERERKPLKIEVTYNNNIDYIRSKLINLEVPEELFTSKLSLLMIM